MADLGACDERMVSERKYAGGGDRNREGAGFDGPEGAFGQSAGVELTGEDAAAPERGEPARATSERAGCGGADAERAVPARAIGEGAGCVAAVAAER